MSVIAERKNKGCEACPLKDQHVVWGKGNTSASIIIVGDYPREDEYEPFSGFLGDRLREVLKSANIPYNETYRTYAIKCRLPEGVNSASKTAREAVECCKSKVKKEIELISPQASILAGDLPLQAVFDTKKISEHRGVWKEHPKLGKFMPTYSLMAIFRGQPKMGKTVEEDCYIVGKDFNGESKEEYKTEYIVLEDLKSIKKLVDRLYEYFKTHKAPVSFDTETTCWDYKTDKLREDVPKEVKKPATKYLFPDFLCWSLSYKKGSAYVIPLLGKNAAPIWTDKEKVKIYEWFKDLFEDPSSVWSFHNAMADVRWLHRIIGLDVRKVCYHDTMLMMACVNENHPMALEDVASAFTNMGNYKNALNSRYR